MSTQEKLAKYRSKYIIPTYKTDAGEERRLVYENGQWQFVKDKKGQMSDFCGWCDKELALLIYRGWVSNQAPLILDRDPNKTDYGIMDEILLDRK